jgi:hypothetical protein
MSSLQPPIAGTFDDGTMGYRSLASGVHAAAASTIAMTTLFIRQAWILDVDLASERLHRAGERRRAWPVGRPCDDHGDGRSRAQGISAATNVTVSAASAMPSIVTGAPFWGAIVSVAVATGRLGIHTTANGPVASSSHTAGTSPS